MEENESYEDKLRDIFDFYDEDHDGYIAVDHVQSVLTKEQFGVAQPQEITGIINLLDPDGTGIIGFGDFCEGVKQLAAIQTQVHTPDDSLRGSCSLETLVPVDCNSPELSLTERQFADGKHTFAEYDISGIDETNNSDLVENGGLSSNLTFNSYLAPPTSEDEGDSAISGKSSELNDNSRQEVTDEDNYEDYGESEADVSDQGLLTPVTLRKSHNKKEILSRPHKRTWQLQRDSHSPNSTRRSSFGSDIVYDDIDGNFQNIDDRMKYLESQIHKLSDNQLTTHSTLKKENSSLKSKVHDLEAQLQMMDFRTEERLNEERHKHQEYITRQNREKSDAQMDYVTQRLQKLEHDNEKLTQERLQLRTEIHQVRSEKLDLQDAYDTLSDEQQKLQTELHKLTQQTEHERQTTGQLLDELGKELEDLRRYKIEHETFQGRKGSVGDLPARYQDLQAELQKLKEMYMDEWRNLFKENKILKDSNEDLNAQLLTRCMEEGRSLLRDTSGTTLAEELEHLTKEENIADEDFRKQLLERLKREQEINLRLKQYVDKIILTIIEKNPSLLEITKQ
ncbi:rab11 family-interacting protein 4-like isoform X4 [Haliotis rufescens]|uniref:rab11 family-interacting protein 4-like isoform X4 n=1 Tax=Haliotis rufescens TaxID=6454 RepID=UPI00201EBDB7|nr:rab11 family-interacting protein 4-like isoform X4 [Haliotis rufescens]